MCIADSAIVKTDLRIAGTEPNGSFLSRDQSFYRPAHKLAPSEMRVCIGPVAVERDGRLVLLNGLVVPVLCAQHLALGETCERVARRGRQRSLGQAFRALSIGLGCACHKIKDASR